MHAVPPFKDFLFIFVIVILKIYRNCDSQRAVCSKSTYTFFSIVSILYVLVYIWVYPSCIKLLFPMLVSEMVKSIVKYCYQFKHVDFTGLKHWTEWHVQLTERPGMIIGFKILMRQLGSWRTALPFWWYVLPHFSNMVVFFNTRFRNTPHKRCTAGADEIPVAPS